MNFSEFYNNNSGKNVQVTMTDGEVLAGVLFGYISDWDNEPDPESIIVGRTELPTPEIAKIELI